MAESPAHRFGQMIGDIFERTIIRYCQSIADEYDMYLDYKHPRPARNNQGIQNIQKIRHRKYRQPLNLW